MLINVYNDGKHGLYLIYMLHAFVTCVAGIHDNSERTTDWSRNVSVHTFDGEKFLQPYEGHQKLALCPHKYVPMAFTFHLFILY